MRYAYKLRGVDYFDGHSLVRDLAYKAVRDGKSPQRELGRRGRRLIQIIELPSFSDAVG